MMNLTSVMVKGRSRTKGPSVRLVAVEYKTSQLLSAVGEKAVITLGGVSTKKYGWGLLEISNGLLCCCF